MQYPSRHASKLFFIRMVPLAPLSTSLIFEGLIVILMQYERNSQVLIHGSDATSCQFAENELDATLKTCVK